MKTKTPPTPALKLWLLALKDAIDEEWMAAGDDCKNNHGTCNCAETTNTERGQLLQELYDGILVVGDRIRKALGRLKAHQSMLAAGELVEALDVLGRERPAKKGKK